MTKKENNKNYKRPKVRSSVSFDNLSFPSYENIISDIERKVGKKPALPKSLPKGNWTQQSKRVLSERYLRKDTNGKTFETPEDMCWRVAWNIASADAVWGKTKKEVKKTAIEFYKLLIAHEFLPNSPTLMNAGTNNGLQYSACFVLPVEDSLVGIFDAIKYQAIIHQTGGGTGFSFSRLRPNGSRVKSSSGTASGPVSFMRVFDSATNEIKQGGKRRGANMGILRVDHPDILEFIHCKEEGGITNFNISVALTDKFMEAYKKGTDYDLVNPKTREVVGQLSAEKVFNEIAEAAWRTGDPGLVFIDKVNNHFSNPVPVLGPIESTNPCGEQPLYPYDSCNLGSIFLTYFVKETGGKKKVDWEKLKKVTHTAVHFLDNVIEMNPYPLDQIRKVSLAIRRIGLGVGGWADMLVQLGIPYDSEEAFELGGKVMKTIQAEALTASEELAKERGPFPMLSASIYKNKKPRRNSTVTTIAPTGSISIIAGASSGIEPLFAIAFQHIVKDKHLDRTLTFFNPMFEKMAKEKGVWNDDIKEKVAGHGVVRNIEEMPGDLREVFGTAHEIHHDWHIKMQAAFQKYTENAVSKTINMKKSVSVEDIRKAYLTAWKNGCMGVTVFRDGCKEEQVLNLGVGDKKEKDAEVKFEEPTRLRPFVTQGATYKLNTPVGTAFVTINQDEKGEPLEIFINVGKAGSDVTAMAEALGRTISTSLRFRGNLSRLERAKEVAEQLAGIGGRRSVGFGHNKILSLPDAIAAAISTHLGLRINGFAFPSVDVGQSRKEKLGGKNGFQEKGYLTNGNGESSKAGIQSDLAGAVMLAHNPACQDPDVNRGDDHTTASAESHLVSAETSDQLSLEDTGYLPKVADICPSCGAGSLVYEEGCMKCYSCAYSEC